MPGPGITSMMIPETMRPVPRQKMKINLSGFGNIRILRWDSLSRYRSPRQHEFW
jgi:hypothetical protein